MYFLIDNSEEGKIRLAFGLNNKWVQGEFIGGRRNLLDAVDEFLLQQGVGIKDIKGLAVVVGRGRFTLTRISVTVANTLAFVLRVPVVGVRGVDLDALGEIIAAAPVGRFVSAEYSGEANIGKKKIE